MGWQTPMRIWQTEGSVCKRRGATHIWPGTSHRSRDRCLWQSNRSLPQSTKGQEATTCSILLIKASTSGVELQDTQQGAVSYCWHTQAMESLPKREQGQSKGLHRSQESGKLHFDQGTELETSPMVRRTRSLQLLDVLPERKLEWTSWLPQQKSRLCHKYTKDRRTDPRGQRQWELSIPSMTDCSHIQNIWPRRRTTCARSPYQGQGNERPLHA